MVVTEICWGGEGGRVGPAKEELISFNLPVSKTIAVKVTDSLFLFSLSFLVHLSRRAPSRSRPLSLFFLFSLARPLVLILPHPPSKYTLGAGHPTFSFFFSFQRPQFIPSPPLPPTVKPPHTPPPMAIQILPEICISPPPPSEDLVEPFSPFDGVHIVVHEDEDSFRPALLSPPPTVPMFTPKHLSPLSPPDVPVKGQGLERERFERLLKSSRERSAALGNKRSPDLRKEIALKTYKSKQCTSPLSLPPIRVPR